MTLELHATPKEVMRAVEALREFGAKRGLGETEIFGAMLSLEECGSNIVDHALRRDSAQTFTVRMNYADSLLTLELRDPGPEFDPTAAPTEFQYARDEQPLGGWGIQLVRRYMDQVQYRREGGENVLSHTKRLLGGKEK